ncbi:long-chain fatty acid--CoA ligase [Calderihabitans maritimus]|uniref:Acyl-CoA synthetase n=1 Tax=Calderihabitans maritimus TaxID=1246530 RepID=A0A1Z5HTB3_9FIRM|nr:long-chain fatty acid--CoA ligase [Calderihabitans maritimus]GAW92678.1 AMP-dependent synthetase and ligase [Calderihabitans maritimus]
MSADTLPKLLVAKAKRFGDKKVALREKDFGIWQEVTWEEYLQKVKHFALGLMSLGFQRGDKVAIIGDNRPEWIYSELAAQSAGGVSVGIYQDSLAKEVSYIIDHSDARFVVVEDQEQVDKILEIKDAIPKVQRVVYYEPKGLRNYNDPLLMEFTEMLELGKKFEAKHPQLFEEQVAAGREEDVAIISYTSGTTGFPKGAMLTHGNLLSMARNLIAVDPLTEKDEYVSFLPLAWIGEQMMSLSSALTVGFTVNFPEEPETVQENLREIGPHVMFSPPRIWEDMVSKVQVKIEDSTFLKKFLYRLFLPAGYKMADHKFQKTTPSLLDRFLYVLGDFLVFSAIKDHLGLLRLKRAYTGGAALGPDVFRFFHALGVNLKQIYGQTEISGISVVHRDDDIKFHTVGKPIPQTEVKIAENGEILSRSPSVFKGYYKNPQATAEALAGGWLHSGDAGYIDENGHLVVIDRQKDVIRLADGTIFSPQYIENKLKFSMYIKEAVIVGKDKPYVVAMINLDAGNVGKWAENHQIAYTTYIDLSQKQEVLELIRQEVERVNSELPKAARIHKFVVLHKELDADDEELTRTKKVRRGYIAEKYKELIEALYGEGQEFKVKGKIRYRDGREALVETALKIMYMQTEVA